MTRTLDFLINKNVDYAINLLSSNLEIDRSLLVEKFLNYDFSGTEYFDKVFREIVGVTIWDITEINWYRLCDAYDLAGENYPVI
ncbi:hypothetical protein UFOVP699_154 [uncultured Caudovirales phage]|uniref:Uncharacterized protein n=1 Tax=uncultured Caudovirales phage TaxID=2100421 RepID=A0A6J5NQR4_9CAUD|nr:hypothetical protein UFOVP699_154 [uncultured Caudovirales phage]